MKILEKIKQYFCDHLNQTTIAEPLALGTLGCPVLYWYETKCDDCGLKIKSWQNVSNNGYLAPFTLTNSLKNQIRHENT